MSRTFTALQRLVPQHAVSRWAGTLANARTPWLKSLLIRAFTAVYGVNLAEAEQPEIGAYGSFNEFFTRALAPEARPQPADPLALVSPADGTLSQAGRVTRGRLLQAKGHTYSLEALAGEPARQFEGGTFLTIYLAPRDYHRVHAPVAGLLTRTRAVPGALYSVNAMTEGAIRGLFARNERLVCTFDTAHGQVLVVLVGAMIVASIETIWPGPSSPYQQEIVTEYDAATPGNPFARGAEIGRFLLGSTVIVCLEPGRVQLGADLEPGRRLTVGETVGRLVTVGSR